MHYNKIAVADHTFIAATPNVNGQPTIQPGDNTESSYVIKITVLIMLLRIIIIVSKLGETVLY